MHHERLDLARRRPSLLHQLAGRAQEPVQTLVGDGRDPQALELHVVGGHVGLGADDKPGPFQEGGFVPSELVQ